jgi:VWFA-related protein
MPEHFLRYRRNYRAAIDRWTVQSVLKIVWPADMQLRVLPIAAIFLAGLPAMAAQTAQPPAPIADSEEDAGFVLRQTVRRVLVDVIVTDAQGNPVPGLRAADFRLAEDGKAQSIRTFEWHGAESLPDLTSPLPRLPAHTFMNLPPAPQNGPLTVLLYDVLNTPLKAQPYAHAQMSDFLKKDAGEQIAIFVLGDRLRLLQGFTSDRELLLRVAAGPGMGPERSPWQTAGPSASAPMDNSKAAQRQNPGPQPGAAMDVPNPSSSQPVDMQSALKHMEALESSAMLDRRVDTTLEAFEQIGRFLAGVAGRKNLIWFSGSFPAGVGPDPVVSFGGDDAIRFYSGRMRRASDLLNAAQVAVYPVDATGLRTNPLFDAAQPSSSGSVSDGVQAASKAVSDFSRQAAATQASMDEIAEQTGGRPFYNTNGLTRALGAAAADGSAYYTLVYAPTNAKYDGSVRRISVSLERGGYHLTYRKSYFADDLAAGADRQAGPEADRACTDSLAAAAHFGAPQAHQLVFAAHLDAVGSPAPATKAQMASLAPSMEQAAKAEHRKFVPPAAPVLMQQYAIQYAVLAEQLDLPTSARSAYLPHLSLAALAFNANGDTLCGIDTRIEDAIPASRIDDVLQNGYRPVQLFLVPVTATVIRLAVRDDRSGRLGSMEIRLPLPPEAQPASHMPEKGTTGSGGSQAPSGASSHPRTSSNPTVPHGAAE